MRKSKEKEVVVNASVGEPEFFDRSLLQQSPEERYKFFEKQCLIEHPHLMTALDAILRQICSPGDGATSRREAKMILVIGPSRVGKTTLIKLLEKRLLAYAKAQMESDPSFIPFVSVEAPSSGTGRFRWADYYKQVLHAFNHPLVESPTRTPSPELLQGAMMAALWERRPLVFIVDEAHHLAHAPKGSRLQSQLDHLKHVENMTGISHILVGTYEMRPFRTVNAQLACRSVDVHFSRYDISKEKDMQIFRSVLWALQRQMPVEDEPLLVQKHTEFLYMRSTGCIGRLKLHLNDALNLALHTGSRTLTKEHLYKTAMPAMQVKLAFDAIAESEVEFIEPENIDEKLLDMFKKHPSPKTLRNETNDSPLPPATKDKKRNHKPGKRNPDRDGIG